MLTIATSEQQAATQDSSGVVMGRRRGGKLRVVKKLCCVREIKLRLFSFSNHLFYYCYRRPQNVEQTT